MVKKLKPKKKINRCKVGCSNPTNHEFLKQIKISKDNGEKFIMYYIEYDGKNIGMACYNKVTEWVGYIDIDEKYQKMGLATYLYDYIESEYNITLRPSRILLGAGEAFWKNRVRKKESQY